MAGSEVDNPASRHHLVKLGNEMLSPIEKVLLLQNVDVFPTMLDLTGVKDREASESIVVFFIVPHLWYVVFFRDLTLCDVSSKFLPNCTF